VVNGGIAVWTLMDYYERSQLGGSARSPAAFADGRAEIPENHNGVNDLLDEARWEMTFLLEMQVPQGAHMRLPVGLFPKGRRLTFSEVDTSGMAHHKLSDEHWTSLPTPPQDDREVRYLYPPSTAATLNLAATAAQCARIWKTIDPNFSARCLTAAGRAFAAAQRNPEIYFVGDFTGGGGYGDPKVSDEFYWAACELFITTGEDRYRKVLAQSPYYLAAPTPGLGGSGDVSWGETAALGTISLATVPNRLGSSEIGKARANLVAAAGGYLTQASHEGYAIPYSASSYPWGSNGSLLNHAMVLGVAYDHTGQRRYRDGAVDALDYVLGRNPLDQSFVSGYGARPLMNPHHRFWAHKLDPRLPYAPPGVLSGGPNSISMGDPVASKLKGLCYPQTCWVDDIRAYTVNEEAINWNAPLFWVASFLDEKGQR
jgi:endoglucanase